jgi:hypothetical protein
MEAMNEDIPDHWCDQALLGVIVAATLGSAITWALLNVPMDWLIILVIVLGGGVIALGFRLYRTTPMQNRSKETSPRSNESRANTERLLVDGLTLEGAGDCRPGYSK